MRLTKSTDITLRIAMRLAVLGDTGDAPTTREVASAVQVPYTHAAKVVSKLQHLGAVEARRGRGGGLALTTAGRTGSLGRLVRELEGTDDVVGCEDDPPCPLRGGAGCAVHCGRRRKRSTPRSIRSPSPTWSKRRPGRYSSA